ncbi:substrate-binding domain-containing protein [Schaalia sp. ZJ1691]|uniref:LacI family DNA-binding transcriptional regulator n=1 Tax=Schaalia sp. ZJ1691 TaxID=2709404 RepID=UPI0013EB2CBE|nr:substrate-binding domain-containing protein [Schaalia sp. ZJ1691]
MNKVTLDDVAREAGVSKSAVSKALNERADVSQSTRERVLDACARLGYRRSTSPRNQGSPMIAFVADDLYTTYTLKVLKGATTEAQRGGATITLAHGQADELTAPTNTPLSDTWISRIAAMGFAGVITLTSRITEEIAETFRQSGLHHVSIDPALPSPTGTTSIGATNWNGAVAATQHLVDCGHRRIGFIKGPPDSVPSNERYEGYQSALRMNNIEIDLRLVGGNEYSYDNGRTVATHLMTLPPKIRPSAIFACNDVTALGVYEAARELGLRVPEDLSVIGFDDTDLAQWATPGLTTVHQPLLEMGARAVRHLLTLNSDQSEATSSPIQLTTQLILRDSTAQLR